GAQVHPAPGARPGPHHPRGRGRRPAAGDPAVAGPARRSAGGGGRVSRRRTVPSLDLGTAGAALGLASGGSRFLFAVPPLPEHIIPTVAVGAELTRRGHKVAWTGPADVVRPLLERGAALYPAEDGEPAH